MRGFFGVLLFGGIIAAIGAMFRTRGRRTNMWAQMWRQGTKAMGNMTMGNMNWSRVARKGRRMIRNMGWS